MFPLIVDGHSRALRIKLCGIRFLITLIGTAFLPLSSQAIPLCDDSDKWYNCAEALETRDSKALARCTSLGVNSEFWLKPRISKPAAGTHITPSASSTESFDSRILTRAQLLSLRMTLDSRILDGLLERQVPLMTRDDVSSGQMQQRIANIFNTYSIRGSLGGATVQQVFPGTPIPVTDSHLPGSGPLVRDSKRNCARPALPQDWRPNEHGYLPILSNPSGFREVGEIIFGPEERKQVCGFTLLSPEWAITALHCVATSTNGKAVVLSLSDNTNISPAVFLVPKQNQSQDLLLECLKSPPAIGCPAQIVSVTEILFPDDRWPEKVPLADLALLHLNPSSTKGIPFVAPDFNATPPRIVTVAGYGASNVDDHRLGFGLLVGWHKGGHMNTTGQNYLWTRADDPSGTVQCLGDSGSAVFRGQYFGREGEASARKLFAVTSSVSYPAALKGEKSANKCIDQSASTSAVILSSHKNWICKIASTISGCSEKQLQTSQ